MPLPKTKDMSTMMSFLKKEKPDMPHDQMVAIALKQTGKSRLSTALRKKKNAARD